MTDPVVSAPRKAAGIKAKLYLTFVSLAVLAAISGAVSHGVLDRVSATVEHLAHDAVPQIDVATRIAELGAQFAATAPSLSASRSPEERSAAREAIDRRRSELMTLIPDVAMADLGLQEAADSLSARLVELDTAVERRLRAQGRREDATASLARAQADFISELEPLVDDTVFDLVMEAEPAERDNTVSGRQASDTADFALFLNAVLQLRAEGALVAGLLSESASALDTVDLNPLRERHLSASDRMRRALEDVTAGSGGHDELRASAERILGFGDGADGIIALRAAELDAVASESAALAAARRATVALAETTTSLVARTRAISEQAAENSERTVRIGRFIVNGLTVLIVLIALAVMIFYVGRRIVAPIESIAQAASRLARGDTSTTIPERGRGDEIGNMADALGVFRDAAIRIQETNLAEIQDGRRRLADAIESISEAFSLYDGEDRLVIANSKYGQLLHPGIADRIRPGLTFEEIIRMSLANGFVQVEDGNVEAWVAERLDRHRNPRGPHTHQRGDGRWILVSERQTRENGIVAVYSDITDMKQREEELAAKTTALESLSSKLSKYLSPQIYESIFSGRSEVAVASRRKKLTVFFSDIEGFTETTDRLESEELTQLLNQYLTEMSRIALKHGATIDKYVGDGMMIFFGDPESRGTKEDALACVRMAIEMQERMRDLSRAWQEAGLAPSLQIRMGIHTGFATVGNFGSDDRLDYTIVGGAVNVASRLETASAPGAITLSHETYALVRDEIDCRSLGDLHLKGLAYSVSAYEVTSLRSGQVFEARTPGMTLALDESTMTEEERAQSAALLAEALDRLSQAGTPPQRRKG